MDVYYLTPSKKIVRIHGYTRIGRTDYAVVVAVGSNKRCHVEYRNLTECTRCGKIVDKGMPKL